MFVEAPFISLLIFGFPFGVISIVCYFMCCVDTPDSSEDELSDSEAEEEHQNFLDETSKLYGCIFGKYFKSRNNLTLFNLDNLKSLKTENDQNRIQMPTSSKKVQWIKTQVTNRFSH